MVSTQELLSLPVGQIVPSGHNPRRTFEEDGLAELADSLRTVGMIEPLIVRPGLDGKYQLVAGERRWRAAAIAGLELVPVVVRDYDDREAREVQLVENLQRKNVDAIQEAEGFRELMADYGYTAEQIAERLGKKPRMVYQRLALIKLPDAVKEAVGAGDITANHAILIARLSNPNHQQQALQYALGRDTHGFQRAGDVSVRDLDHWIKREVVLKLDAAPFPWQQGEDADLVAGVPSCAGCPKRSGNARELFSEIASPNVCTDKECYDEKVVQHVNRELAANGDLVQVAGYGNWPEKPKRVRGSGEFAIPDRKGKCSSAADAIIVHGEGIGERRLVCIDPLCKKHEGQMYAIRGGSRDSEANKAKARAEKLKLKMAGVLRDRVATAILDAGVPSHVQLFEIVAEAWWSRLGHDVQRLVRKRHPEWDADILPIGDLPEEKLERLLNEFSLALYLQVWGCDRGGVGEGLRERAEAANVDWEAIEEQVKAEMAAPKAKGGKKKQRTGICCHDGCVYWTFENQKFCDTHRAEHERLWPQPDDNGQYFGMDCETLDFSDHGADAVIYLVQIAEGWRVNYEATIAEDRTGGLPMAGDEVFASRTAAVAAACQGLRLWTERQVGSKKNRKQAAAINVWAAGLPEVA